MRVVAASLILSLSVVFGGAALASETRTGTGTRIENDTFGTTKHWGRSLSVPQNGTIIRVMGGTYGFQILDADEKVVGDFLFPEQAIGFSLAAGEYEIMPLVCRIHRHHHVEVTVEY
jgi:hypothetical protein